MGNTNLDQKYPVSRWSRSTVADGKWLDINTIGPLVDRDNELFTDITNLETELTAEKVTRSEADTQLNSALQDLSNIINNEIEIEQGTGIKIEPTEEGKLKFSVDSDKTKYGTFIETETNSEVLPNNGGWIFAINEGDFDLSSDKTTITSLEIGLVYHITCNIEYKNKTLLPYIVNAHLIDNQNKQHDFIVDLSLGTIYEDGKVEPLNIPLTVSFDYIATGNSFKFNKWILDLNLPPEESEINSVLSIKKISIHEVAPKIVKSESGSGSGSGSNLVIKNFGDCFCKAVKGTGSTINLPLNGTQTSSYTLDYETTTKSLILNSNAIYKCDAVISLYTAEVVPDGYEMIEISYPHTNDHYEKITTLVDFSIPSYVWNNNTTESNVGTPMSIAIGWQIDSATKCNIKIKCSNKIYARVNYLHLIEMKNINC